MREYSHQHCTKGTLWKVANEIICELLYMCELLYSDMHESDGMEDDEFDADDFF